MKRENCPHTVCHGPRVREPYTTNFVNCHCLAALYSPNDRPDLPSSSLPLNMQVRFLEIIYSDIDQLLAHQDDNVFVACNLRTLRGLISTLELAYVDQDCPDFMTLLTASEQALAITADPKADKTGPLLELKEIISGRLLEISPNFQNYHAEQKIMPTSDGKPTYEQARQAVDAYIEATKNEAEQAGCDGHDYVVGAFRIIAADLLAGNPTELDQYVTDLPNASSSRP